MFSAEPQTGSFHFRWVSLDHQEVLLFGASLTEKLDTWSSGHRRVRGFPFQTAATRETVIYIYIYINIYIYIYVHIQYSLWILNGKQGDHRDLFQCLSSELHLFSPRDEMKVVPQVFSLDLNLKSWRILDVCEASSSFQVHFIFFLHPTIIESISLYSKTCILVPWFFLTEWESK